MPYTQIINSSGNYAHSTDVNYTSRSGAWHSACPFEGNRSRTLAYYFYTSNWWGGTSHLETSHKMDTRMATGAPIRCIKE